MYLWVKAAHIIFVVAWMASLLVYPRYKIHQLASSPGEQLFETMKDAAAKLRRVVMLPSMILVWVLGIALVSMAPDLFKQDWIKLKILLVIVITGLHGYFVKTGKAIDRGEGSTSSRGLKLANEIPFVLLIVIVVLVVVRPF